MRIPSLEYLRVVAAIEKPPSSSLFEQFAGSAMEATRSTVSSLWNTIISSGAAASTRNLAVGKAASIVNLAPDHALTTSTLCKTTGLNIATLSGLFFKESSSSVSSAINSVVPSILPELNATKTLLAAQPIFETVNQTAKLALNQCVKNEVLNKCLGGVSPAFNISIAQVFQAVVSSPVVQGVLESPLLPLLVVGCALGIGSVIVEEMTPKRGEKEASPLAKTEKRPAVKETRSTLFDQPVSLGRGKRKSQKSAHQYHEKVCFPVAKKNLPHQKPTVVQQPVSKGRGNYGKKH